MLEAWNKFGKLKNEIAEEKARRSLAGFALYTDPKYQMNWHHSLLCQYLDDFILGRRDRLIISMPPRHGKSELASRKLPAYIFGLNPEARIIAASYSADLARRMNRDVQTIISSQCYGSLFPQVKLGGVRTQDLFQISEYGGTYRGVGVGGGITGMGADFLILDDLVKNKEEAMSGNIRDKLYAWYTSTLYTRKEGRGKILIIMTRWHEDDLVGRLLEMSGKNKFADQWDVLNLPAILEDEGGHPEDPRDFGEALWSDKYNRQELDSIRANVGSVDWASLYQGQPRPLDGTIFRREWMLKRYSVLPAGCELIQTWDLPFKASANSAKCAGIVMARKGAEIFFVDCVNEKMGFLESVAAIKNFAQKYPEARGKVVEDKANGPAVIDFLKKDVPGLIGFQPKGSKEERAFSVSPYFEAGNVYFPDAPWVGDLVEDFVKFPSGIYKDTVDAAVQGILYFNGKPQLSLGISDGLSKGNYWV